MAVVCRVIWWLERSEAVPTSDLATVKRPTGNVAPKQIELPKVGPAPVPHSTVQPAAAADPTVKVDPQSDLKTTIVDIANCYRIGALADFYRTYTQPQKIDPEMLRSYQQVQEI